MVNLKQDTAVDTLKLNSKKQKFKIKRNQLLSAVSLIPLAACQSGGGSSPAPSQPQAPAPTPEPGPDFTESPTGTFTGTGNTDLTLDQGTATTDLTVNSGGGNDVITTGSGSDVIYGGGGNNTIITGGGHNVIYTDNGNNTIDFGDGNNTVEIGHGDNLINGGNGDNYVFSGEGANTVTLGDGDNYIVTLSDGSIISLGNGDNVVSTGNGDDFITVGRGSNVINTGRGVDTIRSNGGDNTHTIILPGGGADDVIVSGGDSTIIIVGDTTDRIYTQQDITNSIAEGRDLADVLTLDYLNNHPVSDVAEGETLDGGLFATTLAMFGDVDLSGILLRNMDNLNFDYKLTLTPEQLAGLLSINGDGTSTLNVLGDPDSDTLMLDITQLSFSDIAQLLYDGSLEVTMSQISQLAGIDDFVTTDEFKLVLKDDGSGANQITLSELAAAVQGTDAIDIGALVTMFIDDPSALADLDFSQLGGEGTVLLSDAAAGTALLFEGVIVDDDITIVSEAGETLSATDLGATVVPDIDPADVGVVPEISIDNVNVFETAEAATFTVSLNARYYDTVTVDYSAPDGTTGTLTFAAGETTQTFTTVWADDAVHEANEIVTATLSNPTNATIADGSATLTIANDDLAPSLSLNNVTVKEGDGTISYTVSLDGTTHENVSFDWTTKDWSAQAGTHYTASGGIGVTIAAGETSTTITVDLIDNAVYLDSSVFNITLSNISNATTAQDINAATLIIDNDAIDLSALDGTGGFVVNGENFADHSGATVSNLGDINGDGFDDFIIGASDADPDGNAQAGQSYVVYGGSSVDGSDGVINVSALDGSNGFVVNGISAGDLSGASVSGAGDINDDGYNDIIIGANQADPNGQASGASYVVYGGSSISGGVAVLELASLDGSNGFVLNGIESGDQSGAAVSGVGDINNDGYDDILIGASSATPAGNSFAGESYVVYGGTSVDGGDGTVELADLDGSNGFLVAGIDALDNSGSAVSGAGDVNGDGYADFIIGANAADPNAASDAGESYIVYGGTNIDSSDGYFDLSALDGSSGFVLSGSDEYDLSGYAVSSAGDINADGYGDLIIGAWASDPSGNADSGESYIVYGGTNMDGGDGALDLAALDGSNGFVIAGIDPNDWAGISVSSAGDVNGDGYGDLIIGASGAAVNGNLQAGESYVLFGGANIDGSDGTLDLASLDGSQGYVINGGNAGDMTGASVSSAGDVNGDGYDDLLIGADGADANGNLAAGESYIVYGAANEVDNSFESPTWADSITVLAIDDSEMGNVSSAEEDDWYQVRLEAGQVYFFSVTGSASGNGTLADPRILGLYDVDRDRLPGAYDDDGYGLNRESAMMFTATETGTYYIAVDGSDGNIGTYQIAVSDMTDTLTGDLPYGPTNADTWAEFEANIALTGDVRIDALLSQNRYRVESEIDPTVITFSLPSDNSNYSQFSGYGYGTGGEEPWVNFSALTADQQDSFREMLANIESDINVDFVEVMDTDYSAGTIRMAWTGDANGSALAWAYYPGNGPKAGDIWLASSTLSAAGGAEAGSQLYFVMMHELGHALGLKHSFEAPTVLPPGNDGREYTVMAYEDSVYLDNVISADLYPQTFMYYDMLALNYLYGTSPNDYVDSHYVFDANERYFQTIWDLGGNDTIEFLNQSTGITINLGAGQWLDVGTTITYQTTGGEVYQNQTVYLPVDSSIENLYGTDHADTVTGSDADNGLRGMDGADTLSGEAGDDTLDGGSGADQITGGAGADVFVTRAGDGGLAIGDADMVLDFTDGEDLIGLNGLDYADLTIMDGTGAYAGDTIIQDATSGEYLMVLDGVAALDVSESDFTVVQDEWWLA